MIKVGLADYGLQVWDGFLGDYEERLKMVMRAGFDGLERLRPLDGTDAIEMAARVKKAGGDFATCLAPDLEHSIRWTAALGKEYVWVNAKTDNFDVFTRQVNIQTAICDLYGIRAAYHFHASPGLSTMEEFDLFMERCPDLGLILDTANHKNYGMDPFELIEKYYDRIVSVHLKDWISYGENKGGRTCVLGEGNIGLDNGLIVKRLLEKGYDNKWIFVEPEHFQKDPFEEIKKCREYVKKAGV